MTESRPISLTGIKPSGTPHLGNYVGAIQPALTLVSSSRLALYFIADYHALTFVQDRQEMDRLTYEVAASWLASGLDPNSVLLYRQSDIPEIFELSWILSCVSPKGLMNRAHAYKATIAANEARGDDVDAGVNMGLYCYPILMSADILAFDANIVPVGNDQVQHIEIARDLAESFNRTFGPVLTPPAPKIKADAAVIPGIDGRKMSKSYDNTIPLFAPRTRLRELIFRYKTDSSKPDAPKDPQASPLFALYAQFATAEQIEAMRHKFHEGIGWGKVKEELFEVIDAILAPRREHYTDLLRSRESIEGVLRAGAERARPLAQATLARVRSAVGVRA
jgi:tryptophanyl-tRNA synthetase